MPPAPAAVAWMAPQAPMTDVRAATAQRPLLADDEWLLLHEAA
jgi:hypothetical protein